MKNQFDILSLNLKDFTKYVSSIFTVASYETLFTIQLALSQSAALGRSLKKVLASVNIPQQQDAKWYIASGQCNDISAMLYCM